MSWDKSLYNSCWNLRTTELSLGTAQKLCQNLNKLANYFFSTHVVILKPSLNNLQATLATLWFSFFAEITAVPAFKGWCLSSSCNKADEHSNPGSVSFGKTNQKAKNVHHLSRYVSCCFKKNYLSEHKEAICPSRHSPFLWNGRSLISFHFAMVERPIA